MRDMRFLAAAAILVLLALAALLFAGDPDTDPLAPPTDANAPAGPPAAPGDLHEDPTADRTAAPAAPMAASEPAPPSDAPATGELRVLLRDERGAAVSDCAVEVGEQTQVSDRAGCARFDVAAGRTFVAVQPPAERGLQQVGGWQTVVADESVEVVLVLAAVTTTPFWCRLVAAEDDRPLADEAVQSRPDGHVWRSDREGCLHLYSFESGQHLEVEIPGRAPCRVLPGPGHETRANALRVPVALGCALELRTIDAAGAPVAGVEVELVAQQWTFQWPEAGRSRGEKKRWLATSDVAGAARLVDLPRDRALTVRVRAPAGYSPPLPTRWAFAATEETRTVQVLPAGSVRGVVVDAAGEPVADAAVQANPADRATPPRVLDVAPAARRTNSAADGTFAFESLAPGTWWIGVARDERHAPAAAMVPVGVARRTETTLRGTNGNVPAGPARDAAGRACADVTIDLRIDDEYIDSCRTDAEGRFRFAALPDGPCELATDPYESGDLGLLAPVAVTAGDEDIVLQLEVVRGALSGRIEVGADAWISLQQRGSDNALGTRCDLDGSFHIGGLDAGVWDVTAHDRTGRVAWRPGLQVVAGRTNGPIALSLQPGALLRPRHADADWFVVRRGDDVASADSLLAGASGEAHVPPGAWTVVFWSRGVEVARREVTVAPGDDVVVDGR
mgnify:CR=1 FL=1